MKTIVTGVIGVLSGLLLAGAMYFFILPQRGTSIQIMTSTPAPIICHIDGAVKSPGVYSFSYGDRIENAIEKAGGVIESANVSGINLAARLSDGQKIYVPIIEDGDPPIILTPDNSPLLLVNINTADVEQLSQLPGIGQNKAQVIVDYRGTYGNFLNVMDLLNVPGIGQSIFDKIEPMITIN
jgi:competence protein ComEA